MDNGGGGHDMIYQARKVSPSRKTTKMTEASAKVNVVAKLIN